MQERTRIKLNKILSELKSKRKVLNKKPENVSCYDTTLKSYKITVDNIIQDLEEIL